MIRIYKDILNIMHKSSISVSVFVRADEEGVRYVPTRIRPPITLLQQYRNPWKAAYHHFQRYSDIRVKGLYWLQATQYLIIFPFCNNTI